MSTRRCRGICAIISGRSSPPASSPSFDVGVTAWVSPMLQTYGFLVPSPPASSSVIKEEVVDDKRHGIAVIAEVVCVDLWEVVCVFDVCSGIIAVLEYVGLLLSSVNRFSVCSKTLWGWFEIWQLIPFEIFFFFSFRHRRGAGPRPVRPKTSAGWICRVFSPQFSSAFFS